MIFGTSYSLITNHMISDETYGFNVANFDVSFNDEGEITISSIPTEDEDGIKNSKEYTFMINNNSDFDINYRLDIIENSPYNMKDVIHYVYSVNDSSYSDVLILGEYSTLKQNKVLKANASDVFKVKMWLADIADESYMNKSFKASILLNATQNEYKYASNVIEKLYNNKKDNVIKINDEYRYSMKDSPNYVWFNCNNGFTKGEDYCEKWQIIGSFKNKSKKSLDEYYSLKIVSTKAITDTLYSELADENFDESYINSYANGFYYDSLSAETQKLILKARWYTGDVLSNTFDEAIKEEKQNVTYAFVALPNVSDYLYLNNESFFINNMMFLNKTNDLVNVLSSGITKGTIDTNYSFVPCIYLRGDVSIISGDGSINNPYELTIKYPLNY